MLRRNWMAALGAVVVLLLQGCAATGPKSTEMTAALNMVPDGYGRIVFYRTNSVVGAAVQPDIRLDGQVVGQSKPGGFFYVDASPGKHVATASTEATANLEVHVMPGQTHYVRSAIGMGLLVGRVILTVEGMIVAKGDLSSLSYTGTTVPRIGTPASGTAIAAAAAVAAPAKPAPLKRGDQVIYRVIDGYTGTAREAVYTVDRIAGERIVFNQGGRIEGLDGTVLSVASPLAGDMDACAPPGGWGRPDMLLGMRWNVQYEKRGVLHCSGSFDLQAQMVSEDLTATPFGDLKLQRIDYKGLALQTQATMAVDARVWYSPLLGRVVRFESELVPRTGRQQAALREKVELVEIRRD